MIGEYPSNVRLLSSIGGRVHYASREESRRLDLQDDAPIS